MDKSNKLNNRHNFEKIRKFDYSYEIGYTLTNLKKLTELRLNMIHTKITDKGVFKIV